MEVNHDEKVVDTERFNISQEMEDVTLESMQPAEQEVAKRLTTPTVNTYLDTKDIVFDRQESRLLYSWNVSFNIVFVSYCKLFSLYRNKSGIWGWRTEKSELVNGFEAKVHSSYSVTFTLSCSAQCVIETY